LQLIEAFKLLQAESCNFELLGCPDGMQFGPLLLKRFGFQFKAYVYFDHCGACRGFVVLQRWTCTTAVHLVAAHFGNLPCKLMKFHFMTYCLLTFTPVEPELKNLSLGILCFSLGFHLNNNIPGKYQEFSGLYLHLMDGLVTGNPSPSAFICPISSAPFWASDQDQ